MVSISDQNHTCARSVIDQLTETYSFVDDYLKAHPELAQWRRSNNRCPRFTDAEVITIGLMQGCLGCATLKKTYQIIARNYRDAFPRLCSYTQWINRLEMLGSIIGRLVQAVTQMAPLPSDRVYIIDGKPIPVCKPIRHGRVQLLHEDGAAFGKSTTGWFFGFKLHVLTHRNGFVMAAILTPANWSERDVALALGWSVAGGILLGDRGYRSAALADTLACEADLTLVTPTDAGDKTTPLRALVSSLRERIETTFSRLAEQFIDRVYSRSWNGLWTITRLKLLYYDLTLAGLLSA